MASYSTCNYPKIHARNDLIREEKKTPWNSPDVESLVSGFALKKIIMATSQLLLMGGEGRVKEEAERLKGLMRGARLSYRQKRRHRHWCFCCVSLSSLSVVSHTLHTNPPQLGQVVAVRVPNSIKGLHVAFDSASWVF